MIDPTEQATVDTRLRWSDGLYGGLIAGVVNSAFFAGVNLFRHEPLDSLYVFLASSVLGANAKAIGFPAVAMGLGLMFFFSAIGGIIYALLARRFSNLAKTPISAIAGFVYGFLVWLLFIDVVVPTTGLQQTIDQPLWISAVGIGIFWGTALCEYLANVARSRPARLAS